MHSYDSSIVLQCAWPACAGHRKAVSYVRYTERDEVVSASTDSTLRMWDAKSLTPLRTYDGHINEKNFVGLSVDGDFIACGSETNEVCCSPWQLSCWAACVLHVPLP